MIDFLSHVEESTHYNTDSIPIVSRTGSHPFVTMARTYIWDCGSDVDG